jgi:hypothetical protein
VGTLEEEQAHQVARALWRLRKTDNWDAARARLTSHLGAKDTVAKLAVADAEIAELRAKQAQSQPDPTADLPFAVNLPTPADDTPVDPLEVTDLWY